MLRSITKDASRRRKDSEKSQRERAEAAHQKERNDFFRRNPHIDRQKYR